MYHQPLHSLWNRKPCSIQMSHYTIHISYLEIHDSNTVEFCHVHPQEYEIYFVIQGELENVVESTPLKIKAGHFLLLNKNVHHGTIYESKKIRKYLTVVFSLKSKSAPSNTNPEFLLEENELADFFKNFSGNNYYVWKDLANCRTIVSQMQKEVDEKQWGWNNSLLSLYTLFLFKALNGVITTKSDNPPEPLSEDHLPIAITKYLHANYPNPELSVQEVADTFHVSTRHLNRLFVQYFGVSLTKTLTIYRINYSKDYLLNTDYSVETIAERVGFKSGSTLSRLFKEYEGITISEYRCTQRHKLKY